MMELQQRYRHLFESNKSFIKDNQIVVDPLPVEGENRWGISIVFRPQIPQEVWQDLATLKPLLGDNHAYYHEQNVHITFRALELFRGNVQPGDESIGQYAQALKKMFENRDKMSISFSGIIGVKSGLILCGLPNFDIHQLRLQYFQYLEENNLISCNGPEATQTQLRNTCHASLCVFSSALTHPKSSYHLLTRLRNEDYGIVDINDIEIVRYDRTWHSIDVHSLSKVSFA